MLDVEKNELALSILGDERMRELVKAFPAEPIFPHAVFHLWQINTVDEMLRHNYPVKDNVLSALRAIIFAAVLLKFLLFII